MNVKIEKTDQLDGILGTIVDDYLERRARGEKPDIEQYAQGHPQLSDVIRVSLRALELAGESLSSAGANVEGAGLSPKQTLGDFRILDELGRGGMGVVYEAEQISMGRRVALKVLPFAAMVQEKALQRFRNEVRAAALLDHPNVVSVYSVGENRGVHYYAMQLIRGQTLADVIAQLAGLQNAAQPLNGDSISNVLSSPELSSVEKHTMVPAPTEGHNFFSGAPPQHDDAASTKLEIQAAISTLGRTTPHEEFYRSVARLGIQASRALQHAHDQGVLHRDIKPGNMMLDANAQLHITDFGLARIATEAGITMSGDFVGTLRYMAPEQALGKRIVVDHRADLYSLGVSLYELLTLQPAFDLPDRAALLKQIAFDEPTPPRRIQRSIPPELETIVLKTMAKNPDERYESAEPLAEDLESFLEHRPIKAKPPTLTQVATKWCRRHQAITWSAAILLVAFALGSSVASLLIWREKERTSSALVLAESHLNVARQAIDSLLVDVAKDLDFTPAATDMQRKLLKSALTFYEDFPEEVMTRPEVRAEMALALRRAGEIHRKLGRFEDRQQAYELYEKAAAIYGELVNEHPRVDEYHLGLSKTLRRQAEILRSTRGMNRSETPSRLYQQSLQILEVLSHRNPKDPLIQNELSSTLLGHGALLRDDYGRETILRGVALKRDLVTRFPESEQFTDGLAAALGVYADQLSRDSQHEQELKARQELLTIVKRLADQHEDSRRYQYALTSSYVDLAICFRDQERFDESDDAFALALPELEKAVEAYPDVRDARAFLLFALGNQRDSFLQRRMLPEARQIWERFVIHRRAMLEYDKDSSGQKHLLAKALDAHGTILYELGELEQAQDAWRESLLIARGLAEANPHVLDVQAWFAWISASCPFRELCDSKEAARRVNNANDVEHAEGGDGNVDSYVVAGWCEYRLGNWEDSVKNFNRAEGGSYSALHEVDRELGLAAAKLRMGRTQDAHVNYDRAKQLLEQDERIGDAPFVSRRLSAEVEQLVSCESSEN